MLLPYYAVIKDSFRAAMANWVLYILLILITIVLLLLTPLTYKEQLSTTVYPSDIDGRAIPYRLLSAQARGEDTPAGKVWSNLPADLQSIVKEVAIPLRDDASRKEVIQRENKQQLLPSAMAEALNRMVADDAFYDEKIWKDVSLSAEGDELLERRKAGEQPLTVEQDKRLNRIALESAFPRSIRRADSTTLKLYYFVELQSFPVRRSELEAVFTDWLPFVLDKGVLAIGLLIAILVTAPILPQMFEPGSLHLLLSKPISRSLLFLSKFAGGCAFILVCSVYFFTGLFLISGVRLGIWHYGFLLAIPIYIFVFAIYYSVSSFAAILYRNTIISIAAAVLFWAMTAGLGWAHVSLSTINRVNRVSNVFVVDDQPAYATVFDSFRWGDESWQPILLNKREAAAVARRENGLSATGRVGLFYDKKHQALITLDPVINSYAREFYSRVGNRSGQYLADIGAPRDIIFAAQDPEGSLIAVAGSGAAYRYTGDPLATWKILQDAENIDEGKELELGEVPFELASAPPGESTPPRAITMDRKNGDLVIYHSGQLSLLQSDEDGKYRPSKLKPLKVKGVEGTPMLAASGGTIMLAHGDEAILTINAKTMKVRSKLEGDTSARPQKIVAGPTGRWFAVLYTNLQVWVFDTKAETFERAPVYGAGEVGAIGFGGPHTLLVGDRTDRVIEYQLGPVEYKQTYQGEGSNYDILSRWFIDPLYYISPKPGEFYQPISYMLRGEIESRGISSEQTRLNPWAPIWSGVWFMVFMLGICCFFIEREQY